MAQIHTATDIVDAINRDSPTKGGCYRTFSTLEPREVGPVKAYADAWKQPEEFKP